MAVPLSMGILSFYIYVKIELADALSVTTAKNIWLLYVRVYLFGLFVEAGGV